MEKRRGRNRDTGILRKGETMNEISQFLMLVVLLLAAALVIVIADEITTEIDEPFKVTSDTSRYTCIISEADNDLSLSCLEMR